MRKLALALVMPAFMASIAWLAAGCGDQEHPKPGIVNIYASEPCGVAPLRVDFRAEVTGGEPFSEPTGGSNWLKLHWDFGDGTRIENGTSVAYHRYETTGVCTVTVTVEDAAGQRASHSILVTINPDTLSIHPYGLVQQEPQFADVIVPTCYPMTLGFDAQTCGFNPRWDSFDRFVTSWSMDGAPIPGQNPTLTFLPSDLEEDPIRIDLTVEDPGQSIFRDATLNIALDDEGRTDLSISNDWWLSGHPDYDGGDILILGEDEKPELEDMPVFFTYTVTLRNNSTDTSAFNVTVNGNLYQYPTGNNNHAMHERYEPSAGVLSFGTIPHPTRRIKWWTWTIPVLQPGQEEIIDVTFRNEELPTMGWDFAKWPQSMSFVTRITPYPCDIDPEPCEGQDCKWETTAVLQRLWN